MVSAPATSNVLFLLLCGFLGIDCGDSGSSVDVSDCRTRRITLMGSLENTEVAIDLEYISSLFVQVDPRYALDVEFEGEGVLHLEWGEPLKNNQTGSVTGTLLMPTDRKIKHCF